MGEVGGVGSSGGYVPQGASDSTNWKLKNYNEQAYTNAYNIFESAQAIMNMLEAENKPGVPSQAMIQTFDQLKQAFNEVGQGAPPSENACIQFDAMAHTFENLVPSSIANGSGKTDMATIANSLPGFEQWEDAGCPKQSS